MIGRRILIGAVAAGACFGSTVIAVDGVQARYELVAVGTTPISRYSAPTECFVLPAASEYRFVADQWFSRDSARITAMCQPTAGEMTRQDSGYFRVLADTLRLFVRDSRIGDGGLDRVQQRRPYARRSRATERPDRLPLGLGLAREAPLDHERVRVIAQQAVDTGRHRSHADATALVVAARDFERQGSVSSHRMKLWVLNA